MQGGGREMDNVSCKKGERVMSRLRESDFRKVDQETGIIFQNFQPRRADSMQRIAIRSSLGSDVPNTIFVPMENANQ